MDNWDLTDGFHIKLPRVQLDIFVKISHNKYRYQDLFDLFLEVYDSNNCPGIGYEQTVPQKSELHM